MNPKDIRVGLALCASHCSYDKVLPVVPLLTARYGGVQPVLSETAANTDTRFGTAAALRETLRGLCGKEPLATIAEAEPVGPQKLFDVLVIAPCTGNTLAKLAHGVTDTAVLMAAKGHLRNGRPVVLGLSTNDGLSGSAANIGLLMNRKNVYFVPFRQDDPEGKPSSLVADMTRIPDAVDAALLGRQLQPVLLGAQ